uniref:Uncharacterized protein n=1 Tax=Hyaloperonospora arabidopsidis (strain Emoy2) TaxID=559515 RepID=M4BTD5_HYAAE
MERRELRAIILTLRTVSSTKKQTRFTTSARRNIKSEEEAMRRPEGGWTAKKAGGQR